MNCRRCLFIVLMPLPLVLGACAETSVTDHLVVPSTLSAEQSPLHLTQLGRALVTIETALPEDAWDRDKRIVEAEKMVVAALAPITGQLVPADSEAALLAKARAAGLDSVIIIRVEDYERYGHLTIGIDLPPLKWDTNTTVSLRVRALDAHDGKVLADLRRDRVRGGLFTRRTAEDLPQEMNELLLSLIAK